VICDTHRMMNREAIDMLKTQVRRGCWRGI
jgi:hypothetical protein